MAKTKIPWADYTINPIKGLCPVACGYCYARKMYKHYKWETEIRFAPKVFKDLEKMPAGSRVFWGSTMELFGPWVLECWRQQIYEQVSRYPTLTHIFLTKQPQTLKGRGPFPWIGLTVDTEARIAQITPTFADIHASVKFLSFEPILSYTSPDLRYVDWVIIGEQTGPTIHPPAGAVEDLISKCDSLNIPVFVKEPLATYMNIHRREFPCV
jgi:protein gp37